MTHTDPTYPDPTRRSLELLAHAGGLSGHVSSHGIRDLDEVYSVLAALSQAEEALAQLYGQIGQWCRDTADSDEAAAESLNSAGFALNQAAQHAAGVHERVQTARGHVGDVLSRTEREERARWSPTYEERR